MLQLWGDFGEGRDKVSSVTQICLCTMDRWAIGYMAEAGQAHWPTANCCAAGTQVIGALDTRAMNDPASSSHSQLLSGTGGPGTGPCPPRVYGPGTGLVVEDLSRAMSRAMTMSRASVSLASHDMHCTISQDKKSTPPEPHATQGAKKPQSTERRSVTPRTHLISDFQ